MSAILWTMEEVATRAKHFYEQGIRQEVEQGENGARFSYRIKTIIRYYSNPK